MYQRFVAAVTLRRSRVSTVTALSALILCVVGVVAAQENGDSLVTPELLVRLPEICQTPDGMTLDADGNIILTCPNYADPTHPAVLMKIDPENRVRLFCIVPVHPETGVACPMGIDAAPNGDLYIADNQGWAQANDKGRILRLIVKNGRVAAARLVAYGMTHPNGVRIHDGHVYVTQSLMPKVAEKPVASGLYRFELDAPPVKVFNSREDENLVATFETLNENVQYGVDGLVFDSQGNLYVGNFGDATVHKLTFDADGKVASNERWAQDEKMKSIDGLGIDEKDNIYVADFSNNAICVVSPEGKVSVLAKSPDCDGSKGGLDQPGEPLVRGKELIVANFDMVTGPDKLNSGHDAPYTISVIQLEK